MKRVRVHKEIVNIKYEITWFESLAFACVPVFLVALFFLFQYNKDVFGGLVVTYIAFFIIGMFMKRDLNGEEE